ncbi:unnamed protein product, partial [Closterium sp. Naga37s-1]
MFPTIWFPHRHVRRLTCTLLVSSKSILHSFSKGLIFPARGFSASDGPTAVRSVPAGLAAARSTAAIGGGDSGKNGGGSVARASVPVVIVGAGPVGLSLSIMLSRLGVRNVVVERENGLQQHPAAHLINNRTMEIFRLMGPLYNHITSQQPPLEEWRSFVHCTHMLGRELGKQDHFEGQE